MARLPTFRPGPPAANQLTAPPLPKPVDPHYRSAEHKDWAKQVIARAGRRCEWVEDGRRCERAWPEHRMHADHVEEIRDGGALLGQGQCLCTQHNTLKAVRARKARLALPARRPRPPGG